VPLPTVVPALLELFSSKGSNDVGLVVTLAVFTKTVPDAVPDGIFVTSVKKSSLPTARLLFVQVTVPLLPTPGSMQFHPVGAEMETKVMPVGKGSLNVAGLAASGPLLMTSIV
jgi:hypothetical protein